MGAGTAVPMPSAPVGALGKGSRGSDGLNFQLRSCSVRHSLLPGQVPRLLFHCWTLFCAPCAVFLPPGCIFQVPLCYLHMAEGGFLLLYLLQEGINA